MLPSLVKMALIGRIPSCGDILSYRWKNVHNVQVNQHPWGFSSILCYNTYRHHLVFPGITHSKATVLAGGAEQATIVVPADVIDEIRMVIHCDQGFASAHIPDDDQIITAWDRSKLNGNKDIPLLLIYFQWNEVILFLYTFNVRSWCLLYWSLPAVRSTLRAVGCHLMMPTRLEWPSSTTMGSLMGREGVWSGICHTWVNTILLEQWFSNRGPQQTSEDLIFYYN